MAEDEGHIEEVDVDDPSVLAMTEKLLGDEGEEDTEGFAQPKENMPAPGSPKWNLLYKKTKDYEREVTSLREEMKTLKETGASYAQLLEHNQKLTAAIEKLSSSQERAEADPTVEITSKLEKLKEERKAARENLDYDRADEIADEILEVKLQLKEVVAKKASGVVQQQAGSQYTQEQIDGYNTFVAENSWFKEDEVMQAAAYAIHKKLEPEWRAKPFGEQLKEVARRTKEKFGMKDNTSSGQNAVEGSRFRVVKGGKTFKEINLSEAQIQAAKKLRISPADYAKQLAIIGD